MLSKIPRMQSGRTMRVVEPTGTRVFLRWKCRLEVELRWHPEDVSGSSDWIRSVSWPDGGPYPARSRGPWNFTFTHRGAERALDRELARRAKERLRVSRVEVTIHKENNAL